MSIIIKKVETLKDLKKFVKFPFELYKNHPYWIPPLIIDELNTLRKDKNPAFEYCEAKYFLAYKDGKIVGRIAGIINHKYIEKWKNKYARFGWIDFINDIEVLKVLIGAVERWAKDKGMKGMHGPLGFTDLDYEGMLVEGYNELGTIATIYNYDYYPKLIENLGFVKDVDWVEFNIKTPNKIPERIERVAKVVEHRTKVRIFTAKNSRQLLKYAKELFEVIDIAYSDLYGTVPLTPKQVDMYVKAYFPNIDPDFVKLALDENDRVVGFIIAIPSLSRAFQKAKGRLFPFGFIHILKALKKPKYLDLLLGAVRPEYMGKGVDVLMMYDIAKTAIRRNIISAESNPELETNLRVQGHWKYFNARQHKRRRVYLKKFI